jgi:hypothetical protein
MFLRTWRGDCSGKPVNASNHIIGLHEATVRLPSPALRKLDGRNAHGNRDSAVIGQVHGCVGYSSQALGEALHHEAAYQRQDHYQFSANE